MNAVWPTRDAEDLKYKHKFSSSSLDNLDLPLKELTHTVAIGSATGHDEVHHFAVSTLLVNLNSRVNFTY